MVGVASNLAPLTSECEGCHGVYEADRALVERMRAGDQRAFDEFFTDSARRFVAFIARRTALDPATLEDIVQSALLKAVRHLASYRGEAALLTWLTEIRLNELAHKHRKTKRRPAHISLDEPQAAHRWEEVLRAPDAQEPVSQLQAATERAEIMQVLEGLPANYALVLEAKYGDGFSVETISLQLGLTEIAVQSMLARARVAFRQSWQRRTAR